jgi:hypothetical protein
VILYKRAKPCATRLISPVALFSDATFGVNSVPSFERLQVAVSNTESQALKSNVDRECEVGIDRVDVSAASSFARSNHSIPFHRTEILP